MPPRAKKGKLIAIEGTDGAGKTTQTALLVKRLKREGHRVAITDFPQYGLPSAYFVEQYLAGRYKETVHPYAAALFYALDRFDAKQRLVQKLEHTTVVSNRYVAANMSYGAAQLPPAKRKQFYTWIDQLEHDILGLPRPAVTIILHVPATMAQRLVDLKGRRDYIRRKRDLHESDLDRLRAAEQSYMEITRHFPGYAVVECTNKGKMLTPEQIHERIWKIVKDTIR